MKKNKIFFFFATHFLLLIFCSLTYAQNGQSQKKEVDFKKSVWIKGNTLDESTRNHLKYQEFFVYDSNELETLISKFLTNNKGAFLFKIPTEIDTLFIKSGFSNAGNKIALSNFVKKDSVINIGNIYIDLSVNLQGVTVQGRRIGIVDAQKRSYIVQKLTTAEAPVAQNFIRTLPGISFKNGSFVIDGRKTPIFYLNGIVTNAESINNIPLEIIEKVEIINKPMISQQVENDEAIINIVLKQTTNKLIGGNLSTQLSAINRGESGSTSLYLTSKKVYLNISSNIYSNRYKVENNSIWNEVYNSQELFRESNNSNYNVKPSFNSLDLKYKPNDKFTISLGLHQNFRKITYTNLSNLIRNNIVYRTISNSKNDENQSILFSQFSFKLNENTSVTLDLGTTWIKDNIQLFNNYNRSLSLNGTSNIEQINKNNTSSYQIRYNTLLKKVKYEIGGLYNLYNYKSNYNNYLTKQDGNTLDNIINKSSYKTDLFSAFITASTPILEGELQIGIREDFNLLNSKFNSVNNNKPIWYTVPSVSYSRPTEKYGIWIISYTKDIILPDANITSAGALSYRPSLYRSGNSNIVPEVSNNIEVYNVLSNDKRDIISSLYLTQTNNIIDLYGYEINEIGTLTTAYNNLGRLNKAGLNISYTEELLKNLKLNTNTRTEYLNYNFDYNTPLKEYRINRNMFIFDINFDFSYSFNKTLSSNFNINFISRNYKPFNEEFQKSPRFSFSLSKSLFNEKLYISGNWNSIFNFGQRYRAIYLSEAIKGNTQEISRLQNVTLLLTYKFGKKTEQSSSNDTQVVPRKIKQ